MDIIDIAARIGIPSAFLFGVSWFFAKSVWPFVVASWADVVTEMRVQRELFEATIARERSRSEEEREKFFLSLERERGLRIEERDKFIETLNKHTESVNEMTTVIEEVIPLIAVARDVESD